MLVPSLSTSKSIPHCWGGATGAVDSNVIPSYRPVMMRKITVPYRRKRDPLDFPVAILGCQTVGPVSGVVLWWPRQTREFRHMGDPYW